MVLGAQTVEDPARGAGIDTLERETTGAPGDDPAEGPPDDAAPTGDETGRDGAAGASAITVADLVAQLRARYDPQGWLPHHVPLALLGVVTLYWLNTFIPLTFDQHRNFGTFDFDLGIFDQSAWLVSRGRGFITTRGLPFLGHHLNLGLILFAPFYWFGAGPEFLGLAMVVALGATVVPIWAICRHYRPAHSWYGFGFGFAFLFAAVPQHLIAETFHPEVMAIPFMFGAIWAAVTKRWRLFALFVVLAVCWKEDMAFFAVMIGLAVAWKRDRRIGLVTVGCGVAYFFLATRVILPRFSGAGAFYSDFMGPLGDTPLALAKNLFTRPELFTDKYTANRGAAYVTDLQLPWLFTPLLSPASLLLGLPSYLVNVLSSQGYTQEITRHYVVLPFVATVFAGIRGTLSRHRADVRAALVVGIAAMTIWTHNAGTGPWAEAHDLGVWPHTHTAHHEVLDRALARIPDDAPVSASFFLVPHLTRRAQVYSFPNPWLAHNWGINDRNRKSAEPIEWVLLDRGAISEESTDGRRQHLLVERIRASGCFEVAFEEGKVLLLHRVRQGCPVAAPTEAEVALPAPS